MKGKGSALEGRGALVCAINKGGLGLGWGGGIYSPKDKQTETSKKQQLKS